MSYFVRAAGLLACLATCSPLANEPLAEPDAFYGQDPQNWGTPQIIVPPDYPASARDARIEGVVDASGVIAPTGELTDVAYSVADPSAVVFIAPLKEVMPFWLFYPAIARTCLPSEQRVMVRVWFELAGGKPKISVSRGYVGPEKIPADRPDLKPINNPRPMYPKRMIVRGLQATVYARMEIDPDGKVKVDATAFPKNLNLSLRDFEKETQQTLSAWLFPRAPEGMSRDRIVCYQVQYHLNP